MSDFRFVIEIYLSPTDADAFSFCRIWIAELMCLKLKEDVFCTTLPLSPFSIFVGTDPFVSLCEILTVTLFTVITGRVNLSSLALCMSLCLLW